MGQGLGILRQKTVGIEWQQTWDRGLDERHDVICWVGQVVVQDE